MEKRIKPRIREAVMKIFLLLSKFNKKRITMTVPKAIQEGQYVLFFIWKATSCISAPIPTDRRKRLRKLFLRRLKSNKRPI
jgi:hypothetical protein